MVTMVLVHALPGPDAWERVENAHALHLSLNANLLADTTARNKACWEWAGSVGCMKLHVRWR